MNLPEKDLLELRNVAIACLALPDLRSVKEWNDWPADNMTSAFDATLQQYARADRQGAVSIRRGADDSEIYRLAGMGTGESWTVFSPDGRFLAHCRGYQFQRAKRRPRQLLLEGLEMRLTPAVHTWTGGGGLTN